MGVEVKKKSKTVSPFLLAPGMLVIVVIVISACTLNCGRVLIIDHHVGSSKSSSGIVLKPLQTLRWEVERWSKGLVDLRDLRAETATPPVLDAVLIRDPLH